MGITDFIGKDFSFMKLLRRTLSLLRSYHEIVVFKFIFHFNFLNILNILVFLGPILIGFSSQNVTNVGPLCTVLYCTVLYCAVHVKCIFIYCTVL
jgi:hypothetical protein